MLGLIPFNGFFFVWVLLLVCDRLFSLYLAGSPIGVANSPFVVSLVRNLFSVGVERSAAFLSSLSDGVYTKDSQNQNGKTDWVRIWSSGVVGVQAGMIMKVELGGWRMTF